MQVQPHGGFFWIFFLGTGPAGAFRHGSGDGAWTVKIFFLVGRTGTHRPVKSAQVQFLALQCCVCNKNLAWPCVVSMNAVA
jgi:hypothetical protein